MKRLRRSKNYNLIANVAAILLFVYLGCFLYIFNTKSNKNLYPNIEMPYPIKQDKKLPLPPILDEMDHFMCASASVMWTEGMVLTEEDLSSEFERIANGGK